MREVDVLPAQRHQLAAAQARVERGRPDRAVALGQRGEEPLRLLGRGDPLASAPDRRQPEVAGRVDREVAVLDRAAEDHAQRHQRVAHGRRVEALAEEVVGEALDVAALDVAEPLRAELGEDAVAERALVAADRARLVDVAGPRPHPARTACPRRAPRRPRRASSRSARGACRGGSPSAPRRATPARPRASGRSCGGASRRARSTRSPGRSAGSCTCRRSRDAQAFACRTSMPVS